MALIGLLLFVSGVSLFKTVVKDVLMKVFFLSCVVILIAGCGKVTQVTSSDTESPVFDLTYSVSLVPTAQVSRPAIVARTSTSNLFSLYDVPLYTVLYGISSEGTFSELSWGRAELREKESVATGNIPSYRTLNFRKDGVEIDRADYRWASFELSPRSDVWAVKAVKVKHGYPVYLLSVYSQRGVVSLKVIPQALVSGNVQVSLPAFSPYDTFISVLYIMALAEKPQQPGRVLPGDIQRVFTPEFFASIQYAVPAESVKLDLSSPNWTFDRTFEKRLLDYFYLVRGHEFKVAGELLVVLGKEFPRMLPPKSIRILSALTTSANEGIR